jgi:acetylornithine deacetylase/succinyl-diaminopimelate desuccinylase family protein
MSSCVPQPGIELTPLEEQILAGVGTEEITALLQALIRQRSDYPPGDCRNAIRVVADKLEQEKVPYQIHARQEHQPNLIASYGSLDRRPHLMFHSHIDTVPAGELERWRVDPFSGSIVEGCIYGRGAGDDKGSVAAQVMAVLALARAGVPLQGCLKLVVVSDEESGGLQGTQWLREAGVLEPDALVVGEQTENRVAISERVACGIDLTVIGKSAHGAMPWAGENAVLKAARALTWLQDRLFPRLEARRHPYLPPPTLNVGKIQGGIQWSIVPERCKIEMDRRLIPGETREAAVEEIRQLLDEYAAQVEPLTYELFSAGDVAANIDTPPDDPFVSLAARALQDTCGEQRPLTGYVQTSDGRWFATDGIPIIIFGPSDPAVAHAADEHVSQEQLVEAAQSLALLAMRYLGRPEK